jgi:hypothetical protein
VILLGLFFNLTLSAQEWEPNPFILSRGEFTPYEMASFLVSANPEVSPQVALNLAEIYVKESAIEEVNHDIAWAQMLLETSFLRYGGQVSIQQNNFAGLGAVDGGNPGLSFSDVQTGVRAQVQHLRRYAGGKGYSNTPVHNRGRYVQPGSALTIYDLSGRWASDPLYHQKILNLLHRLHDHAQTLETLP